MKEFERGMEYERLRENSSRNLWLGYGLLIAPIIMIFSPDFSLWSSSVFIIMSALFLTVGYSERKDLKLLEKKK